MCHQVQSEENGIGMQSVDVTHSKLSGTSDPMPDLMDPLHICTVNGVNVHSKCEVHVRVPYLTSEDDM